MRNRNGRKFRLRFSDGDIKSTKAVKSRNSSAYKIIYRSNLTLEQAKQALLEEQKAMPEAAAQIGAMREFLNGATRGIVR